MPINSNDLSKGYVKYTSRDYDSVLEDFISMVPVLTDLWKPEGDADPGMVLGKYLASVADMLGVNLDWLANEVFAPSVNQRKNAEKLFALVGYELGFYTAARTEVTFTNNTGSDMSIDFGFNGSNFSTLNAYTDIANNSRVITYNILPRTNGMGSTETRSLRTVISENVNIFADTDIARLGPGESVTRVAIEGELRSYSVRVSDIKANNYIIRLPSQHVDTTAVWVKAKSSSTSDEFLETQWIQCASISEFITPEPRFAVTYDTYSNAQIQISNYLNQLQDYDNNWLVIYWVDCSGVIGCVGENVLTNLLLAKGNQAVVVDSGELSVSNLSNTIELPHTYTVSGRSPETAKEAYYNSRNYINTWDSLITVPDFQRFLNREPGVDCGLVLDCQKALEYNLEVYRDKSLTDKQKAKKYITQKDFPPGKPVYDWQNALDLEFDPEDPDKFIFAANFKTYTAMCFAIHANFQRTKYGKPKTNEARAAQEPSYKNQNGPLFIQYKPPEQFISLVERDYRPLQAMSVKLEFGYVRIFNFYVVGTITPNKPVSKDTAAVLIAKVKETLTIYFDPANRRIGQMPTLMEIVELIENCDENIRHFDPGSPGTLNYGISWQKCDVEYFNAISFARLVDPGDDADNIRVNPTYLLEDE